MRLVDATLKDVDVSSVVIVFFCFEQLVDDLRKAHGSITKNGEEDIRSFIARNRVKGNS